MYRIKVFELPASGFTRWYGMNRIPWKSHLLRLTSIHRQRLGLRCKVCLIFIIERIWKSEKLSSGFTPTKTSAGSSKLRNTDPNLKVIISSPGSKNLLEMCQLLFVDILSRQTTMTTWLLFWQWQHGTKDSVFTRSFFSCTNLYQWKQSN